MISQLQHIATLAQTALIYEVAISPKPGLVDRCTNGAHDDMDFFTFIKSIQALSPYFYRYLEEGYLHNDSLKALFEKERTIGSIAEKAMLTATNQINTHKGANFSFAVLLGAIGYHLKTNASFPFTTQDTNAVLTIASEMTSHLIDQDLTNLSEKNMLSNGEKLFIKKGITGVRGEAANGYPALKNVLLPYMRKKAHSIDELFLLRSLIFLMTQLEDTNIIHRGGVSALEKIQEETRQIHEQNLSSDQFVHELKEYDLLLTERHLSPGGAADLLSLGIFFSMLEGIF